MKMNDLQDFELRPRVRPQRRPAQSGGTFSRGFFSGLFAFIALAAFGLGLLLIGYAFIARNLPLPTELESRASSFQSIRIYDRDGELLNETLGADEEGNQGRRTYVPLDRIPLAMQQATIATEDANFYDHRGVDPVALARALYYAVQERSIVSGASTIPQQLVKMVFLTPERTLRRKVREAILASEISRRYRKEEILEIYLNELYYGNLAYGVEAAARTYFDKDVAELTLAESALLAGLPQLPAVYDPYTAPDKAKARQGVVLGLMVEQDYISTEEADAAWLEPLVYAPLSYDLRSPHFTLYVRQQLETLLPNLLDESPSTISQIGLDVVTTLDPAMQDEAQRAVREHVNTLAENNASNGALVAIDPNTGEILAMVGSADFDNVEIDGQVNMALAPRQPGSSIKPLVYLSTFEQPDVPVAERWTPGTLVADIEEDFPDGANPPYRPTNYDMQEHGIVTVREALGSSFNIPAVRALNQTGIPNFLNLAERLGITTLTRDDYGLSLSLGAGEIPLLEMTAAYATIANQGRYLPPIAIRQIRPSNGGDPICGIGMEIPCGPSVPAGGLPVVDPVDAYLITHILADNEARSQVFGPNSPLRLLAPDGQERPAAAKTGTTNDVRDVLTLGFTPQLVTGVWVGNADRTEMQDLSGLRGAAPIWNRFMTAALAEQPPVDFTTPPGVREFDVCADTGTLPSEACPRTRRLPFAEDRPPLPPEQDLYQVMRIDTTTGQLATEFTPPEAVEEKVFKVYPEPYREWAEQHGIAQPPTDESDVFTFQPEVVIRQPVEGESVSGVIAVVGTANVPAFANYELQYGVSHDPGAFSAPIAGPFGAPMINGVLGQWDVSGLGAGPHTLRLLVRDQTGREYEQRVRVFVTQPTATPLPSPTWTQPPLPTATPILPTNTPVIVPTNTPVILPTDTPPVIVPTDTPVLIPTDTPVVLPTDTPPVVVPTETPPPAPTETPVVLPTAPGPGEPTPTWTPSLESAPDGGESDTGSTEPASARPLLDTILPGAREITETLGITMPQQ
jgi:penicillin-binding protein 1C